MSVAKLSIKKFCSESAAIYPADLKSKIYTAFIKHNFQQWGHGSWIQPPATISSFKSILIGKNVFIRENAWLNVTENPGLDFPSLIIGDGSYIGRFVQINAYKSVTLEKNVLISDRVFISDVDHGYEDPEIPIMFQEIRYKGPVKLCEGCWIGIGVVILPGVTIGKNAVVAANAVVTHDVPPRCIAAGIPAKIIKSW